ncbi:topoisomerase DNA-binding C4 zinc finger domain-containing protein [Thermoproteota archaeon]
MQREEISFYGINNPKYILLIGVKGNTWGFPCEFEDDPILRLVLSSDDLYPNSEERRLFYVALTRARKQVFILSDRKNISKFVDELVKDNPHISMLGESPFFGLCQECEDGLMIKTYANDNSVFRCNNIKCRYEPLLCPNCYTGFLRKNSETNAHYSCSNDNCSLIAIICPKCNEGYLIEREKDGKFWGCSNYWSKNCRFTQQIP